MLICFAKSGHFDSEMVPNLEFDFQFIVYLLRLRGLNSFQPVVPFVIWNSREQRRSQIGNEKL
jgi:hypothetical protein